MWFAVKQSKSMYKRIVYTFLKKVDTSEVQWNLPERPPTKIPIGSSVSQIAISETTPVSDHLP